MFRTPEVFNVVTKPGPIGMPQGKPRPRLFIYGKKIKFGAKFSMVTLFRLFYKVEVFFQFFWSGKSRGINSLQHLPFLVTAPVGPGDGQQLE